MKIYNNKYLPDVGKCFIIKKGYKFTCPIDEEPVEVEIGDEIREVIPNHFILDNKFEIILSNATKKNLVNQLFSNDDQIAIMLNYQDSKTNENEEMYNLMQNWRKWFGELINKLKN